MRTTFASERSGGRSEQRTTRKHGFGAKQIVTCSFLFELLAKGRVAALHSAFASSFPNLCLDKTLRKEELVARFSSPMFGNSAGFVESLET
jgi:hypothetical protein